MKYEKNTHLLVSADILSYCAFDIKIFLDQNTTPSKNNQLIMILMLLKSQICTTARQIQVVAFLLRVVN